MGKLRPFVRKDSYMPNKKWIPFVIGNGYTTTDGASGPAPEWDTAIGNPVSFNALTPWPLRQLEVAFSPVQDLHGYGAPWPAGGGKNLLDPSKCTITYPTQSGVLITKDGDYYHLQGTPTAQETYRAFQLGIYDDYSLSGKGYYVQFFDASGTGAANVRGAFGFRNDGEKIFGVTINTTSGEAIDVKFRISVSATQQTAWTPYSNICPISGWDSLNVEQRGRNLADDTDLKTSSYNIYNCPNPLKNSTQYTYSVFGTTSNGFRLMAAHANTATPTPNIGVSTGYISSGNHNTFTTPADIEDYEYIYFAGNASGAGQSDASFVVTLGNSVPTAYVPYNPSSRSISISLGSTVYSGWVDVISGVGEVTMASVDLGSLGWTLLGNRFNTTNTIEDIKTSPTDYSSFLLCSILNPSNSPITSQTIDNTIATYNKRLYALASEFEDAASFKTAVTGQTLVYGLATPIPIQLTPQEVESLAGDNTMWTDADSLEVTYRSN